MIIYNLWVLVYLLHLRLVAALNVPIMLIDHGECTEEETKTNHLLQAKNPEKWLHVFSPAVNYF